MAVGAETTVTAERHTRTNPWRVLSVIAMGVGLTAIVRTEPVVVRIGRLRRDRGESAARSDRHCRNADADRAGSRSGNGATICPKWCNPLDFRLGNRRFFFAVFFDGAVQRNHGCRTGTTRPQNRTNREQHCEDGSQREVGRRSCGECRHVILNTHFHGIWKPQLL